MSNNLLFVLDEVLSGAVSSRDSCELITVKNAFNYDVDQRPIDCDLVVARKPKFSIASSDLYNIPFIYSPNDGEVFVQIARRGITNRNSRFFGLTPEKNEPVLYQLEGGSSIIPSEYIVTDMGRLELRLKANEVARISSFIQEIGRT